MTTMNESTRTTIQATFDASNQGSIHFGQVIGQLMGAGVESYHVDYRSGRTTYYLPMAPRRTSVLSAHKTALPTHFMAMPCAPPSWARNRAG